MLSNNRIISDNIDGHKSVKMTHNWNVSLVITATVTLVLVTGSRLMNI